MRRPSLRGHSLRARLALGVVVLVAAGLAISTFSGIVLLRSYLMDRVDGQVRTFAPGGPGAAPDRTTDGVADGAPERPAPDLCNNARDPRGLRSDFLLLVLDADGDTVCSLGPDLGDRTPDLDSADLASDARLQTVSARDGESRWRVRVNDGDDGQRVVLAVSMEDADATVGRLTQLSILVNGLVLLLTAAGAWWIARLGLRPLEEIEETAERIAAGDLSERVPAYRPDTEVGRLGASLNGMLGQIETAFHARAASEAKLRQFISDASHELRTPIAAVRGHAEMWRSGITADLDTVMARIESESLRMGDLVNDMLLLARMDQARPMRQDPVDLLTLATDAVVDAQAVQPERQITLDAEPGTTAPVVVGDEARLRQVLANLLTNALVHTPVTARVAVRLRAAGDQLELDVHDDGPGIPPEATAKVFDRFYRADSGRARDAGGSGLGLAIVKSLVEAHGGTVTCASAPGSGTTFTLSFPRPS